MRQHRHSMPTFIIRRRRLPVILIPACYIYHIWRGRREWKKETEWPNHYYLYDEQDNNEDEYQVVPEAPLPDLWRVRVYVWGARFYANEMCLATTQLATQLPVLSGKSFCSCYCPTWFTRLWRGTSGLLWYGLQWQWMHTLVYEKEASDEPSRLLLPETLPVATSYLVSYKPRRWCKNGLPTMWIGQHSSMDQRTILTLRKHAPYENAMGYVVPKHVSIGQKRRGVENKET